MVMRLKSITPSPSHLQDLGLAMDAAASSQSTALLGSMATQVYRMMSQHGYADKDFSSVFKFIEKEK